MCDSPVRISISIEDLIKECTIGSHSNGDELCGILSKAENAGKLWNFFDNKHNDKTFAYKSYLDQNNFGMCVRECRDMLVKLEKIDSARYKEISKGTPFYWCGVASFRLNDYDMAVFYFDAALSEDRRKGDGTKKETPAAKFMHLKEDGHSAGKISKYISSNIEELISYYKNSLNTEDKPDIDVEFIRKNFIEVSIEENKYRSLPTTFISFMLEWEDRLQLIKLRKEYGTSEPFFLHLFKGCLLFESLLKAKSKTKPSRESSQNPNSLGALLKEHHKALGIINDTNTNADSFSNAINHKKCYSSFQAIIERVSKVRNTLAHNLCWDVEHDLNYENYNKTAQEIAIACLHVIACLYKPEPS